MHCALSIKSKTFKDPGDGLQDLHLHVGGKALEEGGGDIYLVKALDNDEVLAVGPSKQEVAWEAFLLA